MKVTSKLFIAALLLSLILSCGMVFAEDNITFEQSSIQALSADAEEILSEDAVPVDDNSEVFIKNNFSLIQQKIDSASEGDTIYLDGENYTGIGNQINVNKNNLTIIGGSRDNPDLTATLDGQKLSRIMEVSSSNVVIKGIRFINGSGDYRSGGVYWNGANGHLTNCSFTNNEAPYGGALYWIGSNGVVDHSYFNDNAGFNGGALYWMEKNGLLTDSSFVNNNASSKGGAIFWGGSEGQLSNSSFSGNYADISGGAVYWYHNYGRLTNSTFSNNRAGNNGGALRSEGEGLIAAGNKFENNTAGVCASNIVIYNKLNNFSNNFINNSNSNIYAVVVCNDENLTFQNNTFTNPQYDIQNGSIIIEFDEAITVLAGKSIDISFYVHEVFGEPVLGNASLVAYVGTSYQVFDWQELSDGKTTFTYTLPNYSATVNFIAYFNLYPDSSIIKNFNMTVSKDVIANITQPDSDSDDVYVSFVSDATGIVMFELEGRNYFQEIEDGQAVISIDGIANGRYAVNVIYSGDSTYSREEKIIIIEVSHEAETVIEVNDTFTGFAGRNITVPVYVHDTSGKNLTGDVTLEGYGTNQLVNGKTNFTITLPDNASLLTLPVRYGSDFKMIQITVRDDSIINVTQNNDFLIVNLHDGASGSVVANINGNVYSAIVNNSQAIITLDSLSNGKYVAYITYSGDENYPDEEMITAVEINHIYDIYSSKSSISIAYSGSADYNVILICDGQHVGAGVSATVTFNGKNTALKTDAQGVVRFKIDGNLKPGKYTVKATYNGISVSSQVTISNIISASNKKVKKSSKATKVKITLSKVNGKYLKGKTLKIKFNKKTYKVKTNKKGVAVWKVKKSMLKKFKSGKSVKYTVMYGDDIITKLLKIKK